MTSWGLWLLCFVLWDPSPTLSAISLYHEPKGTDLTIRCSSSQNVTVTQRLFCKNDCEEGDILAQTSGSEQTNGRYRIRHEKTGSPFKDIIRVTIFNLTLNDSGRYRCFWDRPVKNSSSEFRVEVTDGASQPSRNVVSVTAGEDFIFPCFFSHPGENKTFCRNICSEEDILVMTTEDEGQSGRYKVQYEKYREDLTKVTVSIKNVNITDSGVYQCRLDKNSKEIWIKFPPTPSGAPRTVRPTGPPREVEPTKRPGGPPKIQNPTMVFVLFPVCVVFIITAVTVIIYCRRRRRTDLGTGAGAGKL